MSIFSDALHYQRLTDKWVMLEEDLHFSFTLKDVLGAHSQYLRALLSETGLQPDEMITVTAPKGFVTDLASTPKPLHWAFKPDGPWAKAAVIHDIIYQSLKENTSLPLGASPVQRLNAKHTQLLADRIFLCGMRALGVGMVSRTLMYNAVRAFGHGSYNRHDGEADYCVPQRSPTMLERRPYELFRAGITVGVPDDVQFMDDKDYLWHYVRYPNLKRPFIYRTCTPLAL